MRLDLQDKQTLSTLLPEEVAVCFLMLRICFPATFLAADTSAGMLDYIGRRWFRGAVRQ